MHFYKLKKLIASIISKNGISEDFLEVRVYESYYSILIIGKLLCTVKLCGAVRYIAFPLEYLSLFENDFKIDRICGSTKRFRISICEMDDIMKMSKQIGIIATNLLDA